MKNALKMLSSIINHQSSILFLFFLLFSARATAQINPCNAWGVEVCEIPQPTSPNIPSSATCPDGCFRVYYQVYLVSSGQQNPNGPESTITFDRIILNGRLNVASSNYFAVGGYLSEVNVNESILCSPSYPGLNVQGTPNSPILNYSPSTNEFTYEVSSANYTQPIINWSFHGRLLMFVLAVDVFPGESVTPAVNSCGIVLLDQNNQKTYCPITPQEGCGSMPSLTKTIFQPTTACSNVLTVKFGSVVNAAEPGYPNRKKVPVWLSGTNESNFSEIDFLISATPNAGMTAPTISSGLLSDQSVLVYAVGSTYRIYAHASSPPTTTFNIPAGNSENANNTLFYIVLDGPQFESECMNTILGFPGQLGRINGGTGFNCCTPGFSQTKIVEWNSPPCVTNHCNNVFLKAVHAANNGGTNCSNDLGFDLQVGATTNTGIQGARCALEIKKTGNFSLNTQATTSAYCSNIPSCISVTNISANLMRIEFTVIGINGLVVGPNYFSGNPRTLASIVLSSTDGGCIEKITFNDAAILIAGANGVECIPSIQSEFTDNAADDVCSGLLTITAETESGIGISKWLYYLDQFQGSNYDAACKINGNTGGTSASVCACLTNKPQNVALAKIDNYLNGVSTYDLLLISNHILGYPPNSTLPHLTGFQMLAADANMSNSITTFDIVELRKMILGITNSLPQSRSWRFIDKDISVSIIGSTDPFPLIGTPLVYDNITGLVTNKFYDEEFDEFAVPGTANLDSKAAFIGFKVGDVNNTAVPDGFTANDDRNETELFGLPASTGKAGQMVDIPVFGLGNTALLGWQMALHYDANTIDMTGIRWPNVKGAGTSLNREWNLVAPGELRLLSFDVINAASLTPGTPLFFVQGRLLKQIEKPTPLFSVAKSEMHSECYVHGGRLENISLQTSELAVRQVPLQQAEQPGSKYDISVYPNPTNGRFKINIFAGAETRATLRIQDIYGRSVVVRTLDLQAGTNTVQDSQLPEIPVGQFIISLDTNQGTESVRLIRH